MVEWMLHLLLAIAAECRPFDAMALSQRGRAVIPPRFLLAEAMYRCLANPYRDDNPGGIVNAGTAENFLLFDMWEDQLRQAHEKALSLESTQYTFLHGTKEVRTVIGEQVLARYMGVDVDPDDVGLMGGCTAVLDALFWALCDDGDGVLVPAPYYGAFDVDLTARNKCRLIRVPCDAERDFEVTVPALESAMEAAKRDGTNVKAVLLTHPCNPTGRVYTEATLLSVFEFLLEHPGMQLVMDDIFALSVYGDCEYTHPLALIARHAPRFDSLSQRLHVAYGLAKDFGVSGWKIGVFYTQNKDVLPAMQTLAVFSPVSRHVQAVLEGCFGDSAWVDRIVAANRERLMAASRRVTAVLDRVGVKYVAPQAGLFVWFYVPGCDDDVVVYERLMDDGVYLNPGMSFGGTEPGWFRLIISISPDALDVALERLENYLSNRH